MTLPISFLLPSFFSSRMNENNKPNLKRSRSTESIEQALKRVKPFQAESPSISSNQEEISSTIYPTVLKPISISTRTTTPVNNSNHHYQHVNHYLLAIHKERYGDPELRESWWKQEEEEDVDMEESQPIYENANTLLREAFLQRRHPQ